MTSADLSDERGRPGKLAGSDASVPMPGSKSGFLRAYDARGERAIALAQGGMALFVLLLHIGARLRADLTTVNPWVAGALTLLILSSLIRAALSRKDRVPERPFDALNVVDILIFLSLIWSYQLAYGHPAGGALKSPSFALLCVLVALRALRFHPRPILVSGSCAALGWTVFLAAAVALDGQKSLTSDYVVYLTGYEILIGAEVERLVALVALTAFLAIAMHKARESVLELDSVIEHIPQGVAMYDARGSLVVCNNLFRDILGLEPTEVRPGQSVRAIIRRCQDLGLLSKDDDPSFLENWLADFKAARSRTAKLSDGRVLLVRRKRKPGGGIISTIEDITNRRRLEARIEHMAYHDALTGLANRQLLRKRLRQTTKGRRRQEGFALLCLDLDHFKEVNDTLGHDAGDELLCLVTERLESLFRETDTIARVGGDEFVLILNAVTSPATASALAMRIIDTLGAPYDLAGRQAVIGVSIGLTLCSGKIDDVAELIKQADLALYRAKEDGRNCFRFFEESMTLQMQERRALERDLRGAIAEGQFELYYQPVVNLQQDAIGGVEALVRWNHPERGLVPPMAFIPLVEEIGLATPLGEWVIETACKDAADWPENICISVNISSHQFRTPGLVEVVRAALAESNLPARRLELEITETAVLEDNKSTLDMLNELRRLGVGIAMDDFGTGYASLSCLRRFPFTRIKIDRTFVKELDTNKSAAEIACSMISLGRGLGMAITAEGVETEEQFRNMKEQGCSDIQGFLISPPRRKSEIVDLISLRRDVA